VIFGLVIFNRGLMVVGSPVTFDSARVAVLGSATPAAPSASQYKKGADGVVEIPLTIENATYVPGTVSIPADTPVRLVVDRKESNSCSKQLSIPKAGVLANLVDNGVTNVDVPAMPAGSYTLTCGMGMISGSISVGGGGGGSGGSPLLIPAALIALIGGGYFAYFYRASRRPQDAPSARAGKGTGHGGARCNIRAGRLAAWATVTVGCYTRP